MWLAMLAALTLCGAGCAGINASQSVSPLDFLLPGAGHFLRADPPATNAPVAVSDVSNQLAQAR
jgi:hypothetical protein